MLQIGCSDGVASSALKNAKVQTPRVEHSEHGKHLAENSPEQWESSNTPLDAANAPYRTPGKLPAGHLRGGLVEGRRGCGGGVVGRDGQAAWKRSQRSVCSRQRGGCVGRGGGEPTWTRERGLQRRERGGIHGVDIRASSARGEWETRLFTGRGRSGERRA